VTKVLKFTATALLFLAACALTWADDLGWQAISQWDNDLLTGTDDGYTNGARFAYTRDLPTDSRAHDFLQKMLLRLSGAGRDGVIDQIRFPDKSASRFRYGIGITQLMFTPATPETLQPAEGERPYAGWLGIEISLQASGGDSASTATLAVGTTGRHSFAGEIQEWVHQNISDSPIFQGWESQAPGELTLNLHLDHKRRIRSLDQTKDWPIQTDGFFEWGGALGNFRTDAYFGTFLRAGHNLPTSYTSPRVQLGSFTETLFNNNDLHKTSSDPLSFYGFASLRGYAVLHDISLDGPLARSWDESVDSETWVGELSFGLAARWEMLELSLSHTVRTDEFDKQTNRSRYGSVMLRLSAQL
jgi:hypothetical protein